MSSININLWLQGAIEYRLKEHVRKTVEDQIPENVERDKWFFVRVTEVTHSDGDIEVSWSYQTNSRSQKTHKNGTERFTLAEVLRTCMTDEEIAILTQTTAETTDPGTSWGPYTT